MQRVKNYKSTKNTLVMFTNWDCWFSGRDLHSLDLCKDRKSFDASVFKAAVASGMVHDGRSKDAKIWSPSDWLINYVIRSLTENGEKAQKIVDTVDSSWLNECHDIKAAIRDFKNDVKN